MTGPRWCRRVARTGRMAVVLPLLMAAALTSVSAVSAPVGAQTGSYDDYLNFDGFTRALRAVASANGQVANLSSLGKTAEGRDLWLMTLGNRRAGDPDTRPALLVVANLEGNHVIGSMAALYLADHLVANYGKDQAVTALLDARTVYIMPRLNPDGAERFFTQKAIEFVYKPNAEDEDRDGKADEDGGDDLNGDGFVTQMRVKSPEGTLIVDPDNPRLMRRADPIQGEKGVYVVYTEGKDDDGDGAYNEDGPGGTHLDRNWPHQYPYYTDHAGLNMVSEVETRALADFAYTRNNIGLVLTFSPYDNLMSAPSAARGAAAAATPAQPDMSALMAMMGGGGAGGARGGARGSAAPQAAPTSFRMMSREAPTSIQGQDATYYGIVSQKYIELTGLRGSGASGEAGSWPQFAYYQLGLPSFTTPVWTLPPAGGAAGPGGAAMGGMTGRTPQAAGRRGGGSEETRWFAWFESAGIQGFVDWTPVQHPTLGEVEVGGFVPNVRVNPPKGEIRDLAQKHAAFAAWLAGQTPMVVVEDVTVENKGEELYLVTAKVRNDGWFPLVSTMGQRTRRIPPVTVRLQPNDAVTVMTGNIQQQVRNLATGGSAEVVWMVRARRGTRLVMEVLAQQAGGLTTRNVDLR